MKLVMPLEFEKCIFCVENIVGITFFCVFNKVVINYLYLI
jgi:hypothetical protein